MPIILSLQFANYIRIILESLVLYRKRWSFSFLFIIIIILFGYTTAGIIWLKCFSWYFFLFRFVESSCSSCMYIDNVPLVDFSLVQTLSRLIISCCVSCCCCSWKAESVSFLELCIISRALKEKSKEKERMKKIVDFSSFLDFDCYIYI